MSEIRSQATPAYLAVANRRAATHALHRDLLDGGPKIDAKFSDIHHMAGNAIRHGWSKPHAVSSAAELDALPVGSLVRAVEREGLKFGSVYEKTRHEWLHLDPADRDDGDYTVPSGAIVHCHTGGITVIFTPGDVG